MNISITSGEQLFQTLLIIILFLFTIVLLVVVINIFLVIKKISNNENGIPNEAFSFDKFWKSLTNATPIEKEELVMLDHDYDGIKELDNHLPPWWIGLFYACILFSILYVLNYHYWKWSPLQDEEYQVSMNEAKKEVEAFEAKQANSIDESSVKVIQDEKTLASGKEIYTAKCVACHGQNAEGGVGPNLTDEYWLHGGDISSVFKTIKYGIPEKGMIAWKASLKPNEIEQVSNFILKLQGTNPANAKEPQGEKFKGSSDSTKLN